MRTIWGLRFDFGSVYGNSQSVFEEHELLRTFTNRDINGPVGHGVVRIVLLDDLRILFQSCSNGFRVRRYLSININLVIGEIGSKLVIVNNGLARGGLWGFTLSNIGCRWRGRPLYSTRRTRGMWWLHC